MHLKLTGSRIRHMGTLLLNTLIVYRSRTIRFYSQLSLQYYFRSYGSSTLGASGCAPCSCATAASSLLKKKIDPVTAARWAADNGFYEPGHGTFHAMIPAFCAHWGLACTDLGYDLDRLRLLLEKGDSMAILLCRKGTFARGNHFVAASVRGNRFKVYNSCNVLDCYRSFSAEQILDALKRENVYIGPIWCVSLKDSGEDGR